MSSANGVVSSPALRANLFNSRITPSLLIVTARFDIQPLKSTKSEKVAGRWWLTRHETVMSGTNFCLPYLLLNGIEEVINFSEAQNGTYQGRGELEVG